MKEKFRECQKCGSVKPISDFSRCSRIESGYLWKCKVCEMDDLRLYVQHTRKESFWDTFESTFDE